MLPSLAHHYNPIKKNPSQVKILVLRVHFSHRSMHAHTHGQADACSPPPAGLAAHYGLIKTFTQFYHPCIYIQ